MKRLTLLLFVLFSAVASAGRTVSDDDVARALKGALRLRNELRAPEGFQVSSAFVVDKSVCIEYRSQTVSGFAVYKTDKDLVFLDNSWVWERSCLSGKLGQRRDDKDATEAVSAALRERTAKPVQVAAAIPQAHPRQMPATPSLETQGAASSRQAVMVSSPPASAAPTPAPTQAAIAAVPSAPAPQVAIASVSAPANVQPSPIVRAPVEPQPASQSTPMVATVPPVTMPAPPTQPVAALSPPQPTTVVAAATRSAASIASPQPVAASTLSSLAVVATSSVPVPAPSATPEVVVTPPTSTARVVATAAPQAQPTSTAAVVPSVAPVPAPAVPPAQSSTIAVVSSLPSASQARTVAAVITGASELGTIHGVTIIDNNGALGQPTAAVRPAVVQESLADAARRLRNAKQRQ